MYKIIEKEKIAEAIYSITVEAPKIASKRKAGQFIVLITDEKGERVPLTIAGSDRDKGTIDIVFQAVGHTTQQLASLKQGDYIRDILGPLGHPTHIENFGTSVCIGGGVGIAVAYPLAKALKEKELGQKEIFEEFYSICDKVGIKNAFSFDVNAGCSGFLYALSAGAKFIESGKYKKVIVVGTEKMSSIVDYTDRAVCPIFGDGAGAVLLEPTTENFGLIDEILLSDGFGRVHLHQKAGGSLKPASFETVATKEHFIYQEGQPVFKWAVVKMADVSLEIMERNNIKPEDLAWLVPHQANLRIIDATASRMKLNKDQVMINIQKYGNTTSATLPLCLYEWESRLKKGDNIILSAFGAGFTWGAIYIKWGYNTN